MLESEWVNWTEPETPTRCHEHAGIVPTLEPVAFDPLMSADAGDNPVNVKTSPRPANGVATIATTRFNLSGSIKFILSW